MKGTRAGELTSTLSTLPPRVSTRKPPVAARSAVRKTFSMLMRFRYRAAPVSRS